jgi:transcriptional regulator with XRE-family HTH domain
MIKSNIGKNIRKYRVSAGLTQEEFARLMKISRPTVSSWEVNRTEPSMQDVQRMAEVLHCSVSDLLGSYTEDLEIDEYLSDPEIRRLILFAGGRMPQGDRKKLVDAIIFTIETMRNMEGGNG